MNNHFNNPSSSPGQPIEPATRSYDFGPFCLDAARRLLFRDGVVVPLQPKAIETLLALVERRGRLVKTEELMALLWPGEVAVEPNNLTFQICQIRRALGEKPREHRYIVNHPRRGYRFVADVKESGNGCETKPRKQPDPWASQAANFTIVATFGGSARLIALPGANEAPGGE